MAVPEPFEVLEPLEQLVEWVDEAYASAFELIHGIKGQSGGPRVSGGTKSDPTVSMASGPGSYKWHLRRAAKKISAATARLKDAAGELEELQALADEHNPPPLERPAQMTSEELEQIRRERPQLEERRERRRREAEQPWQRHAIR